MSTGSWAWAEDRSGNEMLRAEARAYFFIPMGDEVGLFSSCCTSPISLYPYNALEEYELEDQDRTWVCGRCKAELFTLPMGVGVEVGVKHLSAWLAFLFANSDSLMGDIEASEVEELLREKLDS